MKYIESLWLNQMKNLVQLLGYGKFLHNIPVA